MTPEQAKQFMDILTDTLRNERIEMLRPITARMEMMAQHQGALARLLQQNRRDFNATEAMKVLMAEATSRGTAVVSTELVAQAYAIAVEMEKQGVLADEATARAAKAAQQQVAPASAQETAGDKAANVFKNKAKAERKARTKGKPNPRSN